MTELVMVMDADEDGIVSRDRFASAVISLVEASRRVTQAAGVGEGGSAPKGGRHSTMIIVDPQ